MIPLPLAEGRLHDCVDGLDWRSPRVDEIRVDADLAACCHRSAPAPIPHGGDPLVVDGVTDPRTPEKGLDNVPDAVENGFLLCVTGRVGVNGADR